MKRLHVRIDDDDLDAIQHLARDDQVTTAEWVRKRLQEALDHRAHPGVERKLAVIRAATRFRAPSPDIEQLNAEIEEGYLADRPSA